VSRRRWKPKIGRVYTDDGLRAAFAWIEAKLMPTFDTREAKRNRRPTGMPPVKLAPERGFL